ncbi:MAG: bifunctional [glutamate--ammonia ligase]-adenylyl-L-tyrosine phosphorylase/[glutamate--ammonia-ligase] adenylyltransferase [Deltaproteobacteria bacterium]|nr:bifunctional [glutamate--ammonia ligase]-adenylyl-L-tyrosine phosphorylase/[glutamate--ammonia-ligase] adenylyltransferase [Deltaproteobacteria bacterium]MDL1961202.1 bifunctional [glutamate--ammonia ligase]-adenylyl-L-tyrosine phosphorylase/[glutamate--ammonia-ligase] adenylyltransferase [Deltaproteobacteria bacterium]
MLPQRLLPEELLLEADNYWKDFVEATLSSGLPVPDDPHIINTAKQVWAFSEFVARSCVKEPGLLLDLWGSGDLTNSYTNGNYDRIVNNSVKEAQDHKELGIILRRLRRREMVRIAWRDLAQWTDFKETTEDLSSLAEACLRGALSLLYPWQCQELGCPTDKEGNPQFLVVLGMGKLGAGELNFSSDIDLIFAYPESGHTKDGPKSVTNEEFFARLCRRLISVIGTTTADGIVFRVDTRLRPYGENGPLVLSFDAMEEYYQSQGREWERYAMVKARPVVGGTDGDTLLETLRPFVYRRYLDYGAFDSLREMKQLIEQETYKKGIKDDIKLGAGGIREIEFIGQTFQLIRGSRIPELRERSILRVLDLLAIHNFLPKDTCQKLKDAYIFLRNTEHRLQEYADQQTHKLPFEPLSQTRLALSMDFQTWKEYIDILHRHMETVRYYFKGLFSREDDQSKDSTKQLLSGIWFGTVDKDLAGQALQSMGFQETNKILNFLQGLKDSGTSLSLSSSGRDRLDRLIPLVLKEAAGAEQPDLALKRTLDLIESIERRTCYLSLLLENSDALSHLTRLCSRGAWIATLISRHPVLLDELLDPLILYSPPDRPSLERDIKKMFSRVPPDDLEQQMDELRRFRQANMLRVAAADISGAMSVRDVSQHLTDTAEVIVDKVLALARDHLIDRHGMPPCVSSQDEKEICGFAIVAYGKLGGKEMGYSSDLDLVFLHTGKVGQMTSGPKPLDTTMFYTRLGQRMIHILTVHTQAGILYEVDMRLRPSGASGVLVSSLEAFFQYQMDQAWIWEHQALVRARTIAGDIRVCKKFDELRKKVIAKSRDTDILKNSVISMRDKLISQYGNRHPGKFDLKHDPGGLTDIEFLVQYMVLANAFRHPDLTKWSNSIRLLEAFEQKDLISKRYTDTLLKAYVSYRKTINKLSLQERPTYVKAGDFTDLRSGVREIWDKVMK